MTVGKCLDAAAEANLELFDVVGAPRDHAREALHDGKQILGAVRQFAQGEAEVLLECAVLGHVAVHRRNAHYAAVRRENRRTRDADRDQAPVLVAAHGFEQDRLAPHGLRVQARLFLTQFIRTDHRQRPADRLGGGVTVEAFGATIPGLDDQIRVDGEDRIH